MFERVEGKTEKGQLRTVPRYKDYSANLVGMLVRVTRNVSVITGYPTSGTDGKVRVTRSVGWSVGGYHISDVRSRVFVERQEEGRLWMGKRRKSNFR